MPVVPVRAAIGRLRRSRTGGLIVRRSGVAGSATEQTGATRRGGVSRIRPPRVQLRPTAQRRRRCRVCAGRVAGRVSGHWHRVQIRCDRVIRRRVEHPMIASRQCAGATRKGDTLDAHSETRRERTRVVWRRHSWVSGRARLWAMPRLTSADDRCMDPTADDVAAGHALTRGARLRSTTSRYSGTSHASP